MTLSPHKLSSFSKIFNPRFIILLPLINCLYLLNEQCYSEQWCKDAPFGTWVRIEAILDSRTYLSTGNSCTEAVETAIKAGYRLIDTACLYMNHKEVGAAIKKCIAEGIVKREEHFITSKLWCCDWKPENAEKAILQALDDLQTSYIDLFLLHKPYFYNLSPEEEKRRQEGYFFDHSVVPKRGVRFLDSTLICLCQLGGNWKNTITRAF